MRPATWNEIDYLASIGPEANNPRLVWELSRQLEALRRFDQCFSAADWRPQRQDRPSSRRQRRGTFWRSSRRRSDDQDRSEKGE